MGGVQLNSNFIWRTPSILRAITSISTELPVESPQGGLEATTSIFTSALGPAANS